MNMKPMEDYFASKIHKPFYMVVGDKEYREAIDSFKSRAISILHINECCKNFDKLPDLDVMREKLETADVSFSYNNIVMIGLGEYLAGILSQEDCAFSGRASGAEVCIYSV